MTSLTIKRDDFQFEVDCANGEKLLEKASKRFSASEEALKAVYSWDKGKDDKAMFHGGNGQQEVPLQEQAFFFDNTSYSVLIEFKENVKDARLVTRLANEEGAFRFIADKQLLIGTLNYGNDIGKSRIAFEYTVAGEERPRMFSFNFTVLSQKLDYNSDWKKIIQDLEQEYPMLAFDYLKPTWHSFSRETAKGMTPDLIWWNLFKELEEEFMAAVRMILERPRRKSRPAAEWVRADKLRRLTPELENELAEFKDVESHLYRNPVSYLTNDTMENRFLKYALHTVTEQYKRLSQQILGWEGLSGQAKAQVEEIGRKLTGMERNPFFQGIGRFSGISQTSLILQQAPGYAGIAKDWALLMSAYIIKEGEHSLETKNIAILYEIWCFIRVSDIVEELTSPKGWIREDVDRGEMFRQFVKNLGHGEQSKVFFKGTDGVEMAEVLYNPQTEKTEKASGVPDTVTKTGPQRPDIVLRLTKTLEGKPDFKLTYLFDAKYRIKDGNDVAVDEPPEDAINQMHRYRDAIYYAEHKADVEELKREVIGGYILFPGNGAPEEVRATRFYKSIGEVNIGAFPLRPGKDETLLKTFVDHLISNEHAQKVLETVISQKGTVSLADIPSALKTSTLYGTTHGKEQSEWMEKHLLYNMPVDEAKEVGIHNQADAQAKKILFVVPSARSNKPARIYAITSCLGSVSSDDLKGTYGYYKDPEHKEYWLWKISL